MAFDDRVELLEICRSLSERTRVIEGCALDGDYIHDRLAKDFSVHHIGIEDLGAPQIEQVQQLAGIGRTSTMIVGAHLLLGENAEALRVRIRERNPSFASSGKQGAFLSALEQRAQPVS